MSRQRIRSVKPDCWVDESISSLSRDARLLFMVLITFADDDGRFRDLPAQIIGHGYAEDSDVTAKKIGAWMDELVAAGVVLRYEVDGKAYATFPNWHVHQRINRWTASTLPRCTTSNGREIVRHKDDKGDEPSRSPHGLITESSVSAHDKPTYTLSEPSRPDRECGVGSEEKEQTALSDESDLERARARLKASSEQQVFDAWVKSTGKTGATVLTDKRRRVIRAALKLYSLADVLDAVQGWEKSPHHRGENDRHTIYNDLELLLRDAEHIERFRDLNRNGGAPEPRGDGFADRLKARTIG